MKDRTKRSGKKSRPTKKKQQKATEQKATEQKATDQKAGQEPYWQQSGGKKKRKGSGDFQSQPHTVGKRYWRM